MHGKALDVRMKTMRMEISRWMLVIVLSFASSECMSIPEPNFNSGHITFERDPSKARHDTGYVTYEKHSSSDDCPKPER